MGRGTWLFIACSPLKWCSFNQEGKTACRGMNCLTCLVIICFKEPKLPLSSCYFSTLFCYIIALLSCRQAWTGISQKEKILYEMKQSYNLLHIYSVIHTIQLYTLFYQIYPGIFRDVLHCKYSWCRWMWTGYWIFCGLC